MKKTIFTLNIGNYHPEITKLTYPFIQSYADKVGAEFTIITKRKFPSYPLTYEKLQIYELSADRDWTIYVDSDCLINPDLFDITEILKEDTVMTYGADFANGLYAYDNYFRRDGRNIAAGSFLVVCSNFCLDLWEPLNDLSLKEAVSRIFMTRLEKSIGYPKDYGIDDYVISRNIAKYHLKFNTFTALLNEIGKSGVEFFFHLNGLDSSKKTELIKKKTEEWGR